MTTMEKQKLQNISVVELKGSNTGTLCMRTVIPSKGHYEGIRLLSQELKQSEQQEFLRKLWRLRNYDYHGYS